MRLGVQVVIATVVLTMLQAALSFLVPPSPAAPPALAPVLLSNILTAVLLTWIAARLRAQRAWRPLILWTIWGGIQANSMIETALFDVGMSRGDVVRVTAWLLAVSGLFALSVGLFFRPTPVERPTTRATVRPPAWRFALCAFIYVALYFTAGTLVWPFIREFYEARPMPPQVAVAGLQIARGLGFAMIVWMLMSQLLASRAVATLVCGVTMSILGGIAPLLIPNPYLPDHVRYAHLIETSVSNFLFGWLAGWLLSSARREPALDKAAATSSSAR